MLQKQFRTVLAALLAFGTPLIGLSGCEDRDVPDTISPAIDSDPQITQARETAERYERWIAAMDPYVRTLSDGTFSLDWERFNSDLSLSDPSMAKAIETDQIDSLDEEVIRSLHAGVAVANDSLRATPQGLMETEGRACWNYWWGRRCCYWGSDAHSVVLLLTLGGLLPGIGWGFTAFAAWAQYLTSVHGGFCANQSWIYGAWLTAP